MVQEDVEFLNYAFFIIIHIGRATGTQGVFELSDSQSLCETLGEGYLVKLGILAWDKLSFR